MTGAFSYFEKLIWFTAHEREAYSFLEIHDDAYKGKSKGETVIDTPSRISCMTDCIVLFFRSCMLAKFPLHVCYTSFANSCSVWFKVQLTDSRLIYLWYILLVMFL